jgi:hypothetical protein
MTTYIYGLTLKTLTATHNVQYYGYEKKGREGRSFRKLGTPQHNAEVIVNYIHD